MNIIHVDLNEYDSLEELHEAFNTMPKEMSKTGIQLADSKKQAELNLRYQYKHFNILGARVFWWSKESYNDITTFIMHEAIFD